MVADDSRPATLLPATRGQRRFAGAVVALSFLLFAALVPFAKTPLTPAQGFIPTYEAAVVVNDLVTAALLLAQFNFFRSRALLLLACGYLFTSLVAAAHALTFPGLFSASGWLGAGPQTTAWLYMFWHGGFPLFVAAYAVARDRPRDAAIRSPGRAVAACIGIVASHGSPDDYEEFYCPTIEWEWGDGTSSENASDCEPYEAGKSSIRRRFSAEHIYRLPGNFKVLFRIKRKDKAIATTSTNVQVRPGVRDPWSE